MNPHEQLHFNSR